MTSGAPQSRFDFFFIASSTMTQLLLLLLLLNRAHNRSHVLALDVSLSSKFCFPLQSRVKRFCCCCQKPTPTRTY